MCYECYDLEARYRKETNDGDTRCGSSYSSIVMEIDSQIRLGHLLLSDRKCRVCGETKNLIDGFYLIRKDRGTLASSYSYECKVCTVRRIVSSRKKNRPRPLPPYLADYPDW